MLWEYERANQRDIAGDKCMLCQGGPEVRLAAATLSCCTCRSLLPRHGGGAVHAALLA